MEQEWEYGWKLWLPMFPTEDCMTFCWQQVLGALTHCHIFCLAFAPCWFSQDDFVWVSGRLTTFFFFSLFDKTLWNLKTSEAVLKAWAWKKKGYSGLAMPQSLVFIQLNFPCCLSGIMSFWFSLAWESNSNI